MHEIVTLQLGNQANYVGTHFWNAQESYFTYGDAEPSPIDHNVHFRPGIGPSGVDTFTPRVLLYDLKGGFGTMKKVNALYEIDNEPNQGVWSNGTSVYTEPPIEPAPYQKDLEAGQSPAPLTTESVRYWSDFNRVYYHPRSSIPINEYEIHSTIAPFEGYDIGTELFHDINRENDLIDRDVRFFAEECDQMQGLQIITSVDDAWGGFASKYISELRDEYGKVPIYVWALERGERVNKDKQLYRIINSVHALASIGPLASLYVPLRSIPSQIPGYVTWDHNSQWHTSALLSAAIETYTLPTRYRGTTVTGGIPQNMWDLTAQMNRSGKQNIAVMSMSVSDQPRPDVDSPMRMRGTGAVTARMDFSWEGEANEERIFAETQVVRGFVENYLDGLNLTDTKETGSEQVHHRSIFRSELAYPVVDSFPAILPTFSLKSPNGDAQEAFIAVDAKLCTSSRVIDYIRRINKVVARMSGIDEREALLNDLGEITESYQEGWNSAFSDDDDDE